MTDKGTGNGVSLHKGAILKNFSIFFLLALNLFCRIYFTYFYNRPGIQQKKLIDLSIFVFSCDVYNLLFFINDFRYYYYKLNSIRALCNVRNFIINTLPAVSRRFIYLSINFGLHTLC